MKKYPSEEERKEARRLSRNAAQKRYKKTEKGRVTQARYYASKAKRLSNNRWQKRNSEKRYAHGLIYRSIKNGLLKRKPCSVCKKKNAFAHYPDYSKPFEIVWLCSFHHNLLHRKTAP